MLGYSSTKQVAFPALTLMVDAKLDLFSFCSKALVSNLANLGLGSDRVWDFTSNDEFLLHLFQKVRSCILIDFASVDTGFCFSNDGNTDFHGFQDS